MTGESGTGSHDLRQHLEALEAAGALLSERFEEAADSTRRVARALQHLSQQSGHTDLFAAAQALAEGSDAELRSNLEALTEALSAVIEAAASPRGTVLVIEDDPLPAKLLATALASEGWQVAIAGTAREAEAVLAKQDVSVIVLDLVLPDADGRNLLLRLKEDPRCEAIPVYVASARTDPHVRAECLALGAQDFLAKPVNANALLRAVASRSRQRQLAPQRHAPQVVRRAAFIRAFETARHAPGAFALVGPANLPGGPPAPGDKNVETRLEGPADAIAAALGDRGLMAYWKPDELAILLYDMEVAAASCTLEEARQAIADAVPGGGFSAGVTAIEPGRPLDDVINDAGRHLYLAQTIPGGYVVSDTRQIRPPTAKILLAEDDEVAAKLLVYRLTREPGFDVTHRSDGSQALAAAQEGHFDLAILDVNMPGINGFDLVRRLRESPRYARLPIVLLTSLGSEKDVVRGFELGANDYVVKPFSPMELLARVRRLLGRSSGAS